MVVHRAVFSVEGACSHLRRMVLNWLCIFCLSSGQYDLLRMQLNGEIFVPADYRKSTEIPAIESCKAVDPE